MVDLTKAILKFVRISFAVCMALSATEPIVFGAVIKQPRQKAVCAKTETMQIAAEEEKDLEESDPNGTEVNISEGVEVEEQEPEEDELEEQESKKSKLKKPVLYAASKPDGEIRLNWDKVDGAVEYVLFRSSKKDNGFRKIFKTDGNTRHYIDEGRIPGQKYYYRLTVFSKGRFKRADSKPAAGRSLERAELEGISNLAGSRKLKLEWKHVKGAAEYQIARKSGNGEYKIVATVNGDRHSYTDAGRFGGKVYTYRICAKDNNGGRGNYSKSKKQMAIDKNRKMIALTYDDGPSQYTPIVLDAIEKYGVHVTFFVVGSQVNFFSGSIRREAALGCEIGNHTYRHDNLKSLNAAQIQSVLVATNRLVKNQTGMDIRLMRPPGGNYNPAVCAAVGMPVILWSVDTLDWRTRSTEATIQCIKRNAYDGAVVLMHDLHEPTAKAADTVFRYLKAAGYQLVTVSEMAAYRGGMAAGKVYSRFGR